MSTATTTTPNGINPSFPVQPMVQGKVAGDTPRVPSGAINGPTQVMNGQQPATKQQQVTNQMRMPGFLDRSGGTLPGDTAAPSNGTGVSRQQSAPAQSTQASQPINSNLDVS